MMRSGITHNLNDGVGCHRAYEVEDCGYRRDLVHHHGSHEEG